MKNRLLLSTLIPLLALTSCDEIDLRSRSEIAEERKIEKQKEHKEFDKRFQRILHEVENTSDTDEKLALIDDHLATDYISHLGTQFNRELKQQLKATRVAIVSERDRVEKEQTLKKAKLAALEAKRLEEEESAKKRAKELAEIEAQQKAEKARETQRVAACRAYKGTALDKLVLKDGSVYENVVVSNADAIGISIKHTHGIKRIPFSLLPEKISAACNYDPKAAQRKAKLEARLLAAQYAKVQAREKATAAKKLENYIKNDEAASGRSSSNSTSTNSTSPNAVVARGSVSVKGAKYSRGVKQVTVTAISNVRATLSCNVDHVSSRSVSPGEAIQFTATLSNSSKYVFTLTENATGKVLDRETNSNKSGF